MQPQQKNSDANGYCACRHGVPCSLRCRVGALNLSQWAQFLLVKDVVSQEHKRYANSSAIAAISVDLLNKLMCFVMGIVFIIWR